MEEKGRCKRKEERQKESLKGEGGEDKFGGCMEGGDRNKEGRRGEKEVEKERKGRSRDKNRKRE